MVSEVVTIDTVDIQASVQTPDHLPLILMV